MASLNYQMVDIFSSKLVTSLPQKDNIIFSPASISILFSILALTSSGETKTEILNAFAFTENEHDRAFVKVSRISQMSFLCQLLVYINQ